MARTRRPRSDSTASMIQAIAEAAMPKLRPPDHVSLTKNAIPFWNDILDARTRSDWTKADLVVAAQLAQCQCDMEEEAGLLRKEGHVLKTRRGTAMNPRAKVLDQLARREMALMRTLRMGGRISGDARDDAKRRAKMKANADKARGTLESEDEDMLA